MYKKLAYVALLVGAGVATITVGCGGSNSTTPVDFATKLNQDGSANVDGGDGSAVNYIAATPNQIDTAGPGTMFDNEAHVSLTGLVVLAPPNGFSAKTKVSKDSCVYEVWAQDPQCTTPPCGLILETDKIINPNGTGQYCPYSDELNDPKNLLYSTWTGDVINVKGVVDNYPSQQGGDAGTGATVNAHQVDLTSLTTTTMKGSLPTPLAITDQATSIFVPYTGSGWAKYEGTLITLSPASGKFTTTLSTSSTYTDTCTGVTGNTNGSFTTSPGGAYFEDVYAGFYIDKDAGELTNCWPTNGLMFSSITGIVSASFGGGILPTTADSFAP